MKLKGKEMREAIPRKMGKHDLRDRGWFCWFVLARAVVSIHLQTDVLVVAGRLQKPNCKGYAWPASLLSPGTGGALFPFLVPF